MSTFAKNTEERVISAFEALRSTDYFCLECGRIVRLRMGEERRAHFYHLDPTESCRESGKSLEHLMSQLHLQKTFQDRVVLEKRFPSIQRIADVALLQEKIIFEIQCSPMNAEEARSRMLDYESLGYKVIWILHTKTFLQERPSALEKMLKAKTHYFTDIDENGSGEIFDLHRESKRFPLDIASFRKNPKKALFRKEWEYIFSGDILTQLLDNCLDEATREQLSRAFPKAYKVSPTRKALFYIKLYFEEWLKSSSS